MALRSLDGILDDGEVELLSSFSREAETLSNCRWVRQGMPCGFEMKFEAGTVSTNAKLPPWDDVMAFLHCFRPFGLQNERTFCSCSVQCDRQAGAGRRLSAST